MRRVTHFKIYLLYEMLLLFYALQEEVDATLQVVLIICHYPRLVIEVNGLNCSGTSI